MKLIPLSFLLLIIVSCQSEKKQKMKEKNNPPIAKKSQKELTIHDDTRLDDYFWMRLSDEQKKAEQPDEQTQDVLNYLNSENDYINDVMQHTDNFQDQLFNEIVGRIKKDDQSVPYNDNGYSYYSRFEEGGEYALYCRKKIEDNAEEAIILNGPEMAKGYKYYGIGSRSISPDNKIMAFGIDTVSRRQYTIYFKNLETNELLEDKLRNTGGSATWSNDNKTIFYTTKDPQTLRQNKVFKHVLGTDQSDDILVYEEEDETYEHAHAIVMILAWMVFASTAVLFARYGRSIRFGSKQKLLVP